MRRPSMPSEVSQLNWILVLRLFQLYRDTLTPYLYISRTGLADTLRSEFNPL
jgi:hypothetical protein